MDKTVVSRAAFQRVVEENKKLLEDLKVLVTVHPYGLHGESDQRFVDVFDKWYTKFKRDQELSDMITEWGRNYIKNNPDSEIVKIVKSLKDKHNGDT